MTRRPTYTAHAIKAVADVPDLLTDIDSFEAVGCNFGAVGLALVRAKLKDPHCSEMTVQDVTFYATGLRERLLILSHVAKPTPEGGQTLRPFGELLVQYGIYQARLLSPNSFSAWVEVSKDGVSWRRLKTDPPPPQPAPTQVLDAAIPPPPDDDDWTVKT